MTTRHTQGASLLRRRKINSSRALLDAGLISIERAAEVEVVTQSFPLSVARAMLELIDPEDPNDPIARQFIPSRDELNILPEDLADPIGDERFSPVTGIVHRYPDRLILMPIHTCASNCRFCFRRNKVSQGRTHLTVEELATALDYIHDRNEVWEVILSGGDPLCLSKRQLYQILNSLDKIIHVEVIRLHTRIPIVEPDHITPELAQKLRMKTPLYMVLHCNHPRELTPKARHACSILVDAGIPLLSQTVLLRGINDTPEVLGQLMRDLVATRIKPYYLHHGDLAKGTAHFRTTIEEGQTLMRSLRGRLSGLCQPTYVLDIPGGYGKVPIGPNHLVPDGLGKGYLVEDYLGEQHTYPPQTLQSVIKPCTASDSEAYHE